MLWNILTGICRKVCFSMIIMGFGEIHLYGTLITWEVLSLKGLQRVNPVQKTRNCFPLKWWRHLAGDGCSNSSCVRLHYQQHLVWMCVNECMWLDCDGRTKSFDWLDTETMTAPTLGLVNANKQFTQPAREGWMLRFVLFCFCRSRRIRETEEETVASHESVELQI